MRDSIVVVLLKVLFLRLEVEDRKEERNFQERGWNAWWSCIMPDVQHGLSVGNARFGWIQQQPPSPPLFLQSSWMIFGDHDDDVEDDAGGGWEIFRRETSVVWMVRDNPTLYSDRKFLSRIQPSGLNSTSSSGANLLTFYWHHHEDPNLTIL